MLENFQGDSWGSIPPLRMSSLLPHDLCHGQSASPRPPTYGVAQSRTRLKRLSGGSSSSHYNRLSLWHFVTCLTKYHHPTKYHIPSQVIVLLLRIFHCSILGFIHKCKCARTAKVVLRFLNLPGHPAWLPCSFWPCSQHSSRTYSSF